MKIICDEKQLNNFNLDKNQVILYGENEDFNKRIEYIFKLGVNDDFIVLNNIFQNNIFKAIIKNILDTKHNFIIVSKKETDLVFYMNKKLIKFIQFIGLQNFYKKILYKDLFNQKKEDKFGDYILSSMNIKIPFLYKFNKEWQRKDDLKMGKDYDIIINK